MEMFGVYRGQVVDANDPIGKRRVRVVVPEVSDGNLWAPVCYTCSCARGIESGAIVVVAFEKGDANRPVVIGQVDS